MAKLVEANKWFERSLRCMSRRERRKLLRTSRVLEGHRIWREKCREAFRNIFKRSFKQLLEETPNFSSPLIMSLPWQESAHVSVGTVLDAPFIVPVSLR
jgi:hypothetical protein